LRAIPNYDAVRTSRYNYVEYQTGEKEIYDLDADPTELTNNLQQGTPGAALRAKGEAGRAEGLHRGRRVSDILQEGGGRLSTPASRAFSTLAPSGPQLVSPLPPSSCPRVLSETVSRQKLRPAPQNDEVRPPN
jgi:N-acetylglucosamine-6-sulfatase